MANRVFLDTNIFVYAYDSDEPEKQKKALQLVERLIDDVTIVISPQVLREFYVAVTRKLDKPLPPVDAEKAIRRMMTLHVIPEDRDMILGAVRISQQYSFSFWDSLIVQAALDSDCNKLITEDLQHDFNLEQLTIINPFL